MNIKKKVFFLIGIIVIIGVSFVLGLFIGQKNAPKNDLAINKVVGQTFYASIESIKQYNDGSFHLNVKGLEVNDINYRGNFTFKVDDSMNMTWRGKKVKVSDLKEGSNISITFTDEIIMSISPTPLNEIVRIQILDDEQKNVEKFEIHFKDRQLIDSYNKIYPILDKSETDKYDYTIYGYDGSVSIRIDGKDYSLKEALLENKITMEEIIAKANKDLNEKNITGDMYLDGGSMIYKYNSYTIIKCHTLDGNKDVYIGSKDMTINDLGI